MLTYIITKNVVHVFCEIFELRNLANNSNKKYKYFAKYIKGKKLYKTASLSKTLDFRKNHKIKKHIKLLRLYFCKY